MKARLFLFPLLLPFLFSACALEAQFFTRAWISLNRDLPGEDSGITQVATTAGSSIYTAGSSIYAVTGLGEILVSSDSGGTWRTLQGIVGVFSIAANASNLYAVTSHGLFRSSDGGETWTSANGGLDPASNLISMVAIDPSNPSTVYGLSASKVLRSTDGASTWTILYVFSSSEPPLWLGIAPSASSILYASTVWGGILKSLDGGQSWNQVWPGVTDTSFSSTAVALTIDPQNPSKLYAGSFVAFRDPGGPSQPGLGTLSTSNDGGQTWQATSPGTASVGFLDAPLIDPDNSAILYAMDAWSGGAGVLKSKDGGRSWSQIYGVSGSSQDSFNLVLAVNPGIVYAGYRDAVLGNGGLITSTDGGGSWYHADHGLSFYALRALAFDAAQPGALYTGGSEGLFKMVNARSEWASLNFPQLPGDIFFGAGTPPAIQSLLIDPSGILYARTAQPGGCFYLDQLLFKSSDGGISWDASISPPESGCTLGSSAAIVNGAPFLMDPHSPQTLYVAANDYIDDGYALLRSSDGGMSWTTLWNSGASALNVLVIDPANSAHLYAGLFASSQPDPAGLYQSVDGGATWTDAGLTNMSVTALAIDPSNSKTLYAATAPTPGMSGAPTVFKSTDGGSTWSAVTHGLDRLVQIGASVAALVVDPSHEGTVYAASGAGIYRTTNGGAAWAEFDAGLSNLNVYNLAISPSENGKIYTLTAGGIFKLVTP